MSKVCKKELDELEGRFLELEREWNEVREQSKSITPRGSFCQMPMSSNGVNCHLPRRLSTSSNSYNSSVSPSSASISPPKSATSSSSSSVSPREANLSTHKSKSSMSEFSNMLHTTSNESFFNNNGNINKSFTQFNKTSNNNNNVAFNGNGTKNGVSSGNRGDKIGVRNLSYSGQSASIENLNGVSRRNVNSPGASNLNISRRIGSPSTTGKRVNGKVPPFAFSKSPSNENGGDNTGSSSPGNNGSIIQQKMDGFVLFSNSPATLLERRNDNEVNDKINPKNNSSDIYMSDNLQCNPEVSPTDKDNIEIFVDNLNDINDEGGGTDIIPYSSSTPIPSTSPSFGVDANSSNDNDTLLPKFCWKCGLDLRGAKVPPKFCKECGSKINK